MKNSKAKCKLDKQVKEAVNFINGTKTFLTAISIVALGVALVGSALKVTTAFDEADYYKSVVKIKDEQIQKLEQDKEYYRLKWSCKVVYKSSCEKVKTLE